MKNSRRLMSGQKLVRKVLRNGRSGHHSHSDSHSLPPVGPEQPEFPVLPPGSPLPAQNNGRSGSPGQVFSVLRLPAPVLHILRCPASAVWSVHFPGQIETPPLETVLSAEGSFLNWNSRSVLKNPVPGLLPAAPVHLSDPLFLRRPPVEVLPVLPSAYLSGCEPKDHSVPRKVPGPVLLQKVLFRPPCPVSGPE